MALAGVLELQLLTDVARIKSDMDKAQRIVTSGARAMEDAAARVRASLGGIAGGLSVAAFGAWVKGAIDAADGLNDLSKSTDIAVGKLAGLKLASMQSGGTLESVAQAVNKLQLNIGKSSDQFARIGITAKDGLGAFKQLADVYRSIEDPQLRAAVAAEALGKSWAGAAPLLSEGSKKIQEMVDKGELLSGMNQDAADSSDEFNDRMVELRTALDGTAMKIASGMLPMLTALAEDLTSTASDVNGLDGSFSPLNETLRAVIVLGGNVSFVLKGIGTEIGVLAAQANALGIGFTEMLNPAAAAAKAVAAGTEGWREFNEIGRQARADAEQARASFDAWEQKMMAAGTAAKAAGEEAKQTAEKLSGARLAALKAFAAQEEARKAAEGLKKELSDQAKLLAELSGLSGSFAEDWGRLNKQYAARKISVDDLAAAQAKLLAQQPFFKEDQKQREEDSKHLIERWKEEASVIDALYESRDKVYQQDEKVHKAAEDLLASIEFETQGLRMSNVEREKAIAMRELERTGIDKSSEAYKNLAEQIPKAVEQREAVKEHLAVWQSIENTAHDVWTNIWDGGSNVFKKLGQTLKASILDLLYQMTIKKWIINIGASMSPGGGSLAGAFGLGGGAVSYGGTPIMDGGSNALSLLANGYSLAGMGTTAAGLVGSGVGAIFGGAAGNAALGASLGLGTASSAAAASAAASAGGTAAAGAGLGASLGAAVPYIGAALLVASMFSGGGETRSGAEYVNATKLRGPSGGEIGGDQTRAAIQSTQDSINNTLRALGSSATVGQLNSGLESSGKGKGFAYAGGTLSTGASFGQSTSAEGRANRRGSMSAEQAGAAFSEELKQATLQALQAADVPGQLGDYLRQLGDIDKLSGGALDTAIGRINKALTEKDQLEAQIFAMTATSLEQLNKTRDKERATIDSSNAALLEHVYALQDQQQAAAVLMDAYNRENAALQQTIDRHRDYAKQLREFRDSLLLGEDSPLGPQDRTRVALSQYDQTYARAQAGDLEAIAGLQGASTAYLAALKGSAGSAGEYNAGFAKVMSGLTLTAAASDAAATVGQSQLSVATEQLTALGLINTNLVSFQDALAGYLAAVANTKSAADAAAAIAAAPAAAPDGQTTWSKLHDRVDETIKKMGPGGGSGAVLNGIVDEVAGGGSGAILNYIPQFATGGMYLGGARIVGEDGPELEVTGPARIFSASQTREILRGGGENNNQELLAEVRLLRKEIADLKAAANSTAISARRTSDALETAMQDGDSLRTTVVV